MMETMLRSILAMAMFSAACGPRPPITPPEMDTLGGQLIRLSRAVAAAVNDDPTGTAALADPELLARATARDSTLLPPFAGYRLTTHREGGFVSVLVCTHDGTRGLLEDTACTTKLDAKPWQDAAAAPCQPTVILADACKRE
jgi:hypothetical protein